MDRIKKRIDALKSKIAVLVFIIAVLFIFGLWVVFYYIPEIAESRKLTLTNNFELLDPARDLYDKKNLIVDVQPLRNELSAIGEDKNISVYFEFLNTGANISINKDQNFFPASLLKLPLAMTAVKKIEKGDWKWESRLVVMASDKDNRFGNLYEKPIGTTMTIEELVKEMLSNSDNTAYFMILRNLEPDEFLKTQESLGLRDFFSEDGKISAKNYSVILRALYEASYLNAENSQKLLDFMAKSPFTGYLSSGLPHDIIFAHKIGLNEEESVHLDAGIVYSKARPYFLIAMINTSDKKYAEAKMKEISEKTYNFVSKYHEEN